MLTRFMMAAAIAPHPGVLMSNPDPDTPDTPGGPVTPEVKPPFTPAHTDPAKAR
jgi:hypothetical protein